MSDKDIILSTVSDLVGSFLFYDRKEDEELPKGAIEYNVSSKVVTVEEIVKHFESELNRRLSNEQVSRIHARRHR